MAPLPIPLPLGFGGKFIFEFQSYEIWNGKENCLVTSLLKKFGQSVFF